ncbi:hypothetical protein ABZ570_30985 [Micromonospora sp. NPDC007271]|uniref:hypothetical protein n=1 Tax=Micromonospora sp. NPDC007271 TaxID=3154587 RepID=UPI0033CE4336
MKTGTVYLIHFDRPYRHVKHYIGWTLDLETRLADHAADRDARLLALITAARIGFRLARTWTGTRGRERQIKRQGGIPLLPALRRQAAPEPVSDHLAYRQRTARHETPEPPPRHPSPELSPTFPHHPPKTTTKSWGGSTRTSPPPEPDGSATRSKRTAAMATADTSESASGVEDCVRVVDAALADARQVLAPAVEEPTALLLGMAAALADLGHEESKQPG